MLKLPVKNLQMERRFKTTRNRKEWWLPNHGNSAEPGSACQAQILSDWHLQCQDRGRGRKEVCRKFAQENKEEGEGLHCQPLKATIHSFQLHKS